MIENNKLKGRVLAVLTSANFPLGKDGPPSGYYFPEVIDFYIPLFEAEYEVDFVSPKGGIAPMYNRESTLLQYSPQLKKLDLLNKLDNTLSPEDVDFKNYKAIYYVGGYGCLGDLPTDSLIGPIASKIYESGGIVSAVCHGPAGLLNIMLSNGEFLIKGKKLTSFSVEEDTQRGRLTKEQALEFFPLIVEDALIEKGAEYSKNNPGESYVVIDGRLITGQNPASTKGVAKAVIDQLNIFTGLS